MGGRARLSIEGLGPHCPPHFLGLLHSQAAVAPVTAAVTSLHHLCGLLDLLPWNVVLCGREGSQCLHPSQTSCSLVPDRVTSMSGSSPCHGDASRPAVPQAGAQGNLLHHGPVLHPCLAILQVHSPGGGPLQPSKQPVALHKLRFMSLVI